MFLWLLWLLWRASNGEVWDPFVSAAASFSLVAVTIYYAWQAQKSAQHTKETLDEMEKDRAKYGKKLTIGMGIDPINNTLTKHHENWTNWEDEYYPRIEGEWTSPDREFSSDIEEHYPNFADDFEIFIQSVSDYQKKRKSLHENLVEFLLVEAEEPLKTFSLYGDNPDERESRRHCQDMSSYALNPDGENELDSWLIGEGRKNVWDQIKREVFNLRDEPEFQDEFEELDSDFEHLIESCRHLSDKLDSTRGSIKKEFNISDLEIEEVKSTSELDNQIDIVSNGHDIIEHQP